MALLLFAPAVAAESTGSRADELIAEGDELMRSSDFEEGTARYRQAFEAAPSFTAACKAGRGEAQLERYPQAAHYLSYCLEHFTTTPNEREREARGRYEALLKEVLEQVGVVNLELTPVGAQVRVGGEATHHAATAKRLFIAPGEHQVEISAPGFTTLRRSVSVATGTPQVLRATLVALPTNDGPPPAAPAPDTSADHGDPMMLRNALILTGAVITVGTIAGGVAMLVGRGSVGDEIEALGPRLPESGCSNSQTGACRELRVLQDDWVVKDRTAKILFGVGIGFGVATVLTYLLWPESTSEPAETAGAGRPLFHADPLTSSVSLGWSGAF
ncbi:MAG: PEGA domain-containing protein [Polyangiaceae bacterium]|nr:PEGA domain-containing protein [Polyangiaceae bacterium]MCW5789722.1 PEGA domain-containing protein [Polyangiaceae bacterium]